jgi:ribosomal protein S18 acetylase RimI-like enzyme
VLLYINGGFNKTNNHLNFNNSLVLLEGEKSAIENIEMFLLFLGIKENMDVDIKIRTYVPEDFWGVRKLAEYFYEGNSVAAAVIIRQAEQLFKSSLIVADINNSHKIIGFAMGLVSQDKTDEACIMAIFVDINIRRKQVAFHLIDFLIKIFKEKGVHRVFLTVNSENTPAIKFYKKYGFKKYFELNNYYVEGRNIEFYEYFISNQPDIGEGIQL